jgi:hypothetical protein
MLSLIRQRSDGGRMSVYRCRYCQSFHFGHDASKAD